MSVVDASLLGASNNDEEPGHAAAVAWLNRAIAEVSELRAPTILIPEVASAILRVGRSTSSAYGFIDRIRGLVELHPVDAALAARAATLVLELGLRGCDAIYVALAEQLGEELVTLDKQQFERAQAVVRTVYP